MESFCEKLKTLLTHSFISKQQSAFHMEVKSSLQSGVFQVIADFAENYSFILQDEAQGFHCVTADCEPTTLRSILVNAHCPHGAHAT